MLGSICSGCMSITAIFFAPRHRTLFSVEFGMLFLVGVVVVVFFSSVADRFSFPWRKLIREQHHSPGVCAYGFDKYASCFLLIFSIFSLSLGFSVDTRCNVALNSFHTRAQKTMQTVFGTVHSAYSMCVDLCNEYMKRNMYRSVVRMHLSSIL